MRLASLALPLALALAGCSGEALLHGLDEPQANDVLVALDEGGIAAEKAREDGADGGWEVRVAAADASRARRVLAERELPRQRPAGFDAVLAKGSMVPTATEEHAMYLHALSGELARSIEAIDGVVGARVHLGLPQADPFRPGERPAPRAAVLVRCRAAACAAVRALEPGLRALVAGAADGLDAAAVSVVFAEAPQASAPPPAPRRGRSPVLLALAAAAGAAAIAVGGGAGWRRRRGKPS
ncbi:secretion protein [Anaeromyxobacter sp. Red801]|uniref:secretion protein n=1 Tax=Anaeromyxobacter sp. Red801 TaxID=3411632 RepID=UPI003B9FCB2B